MVNRFPVIAKVGGFIFALILVFAGILMLRSGVLMGGLSMLLIGLTIFLFSSQSLENLPLNNAQLALLKPYRWMIVSWASSLALTVWILYQQARPANKVHDLRWNGVLWIVAIFLLVVGALSVGGWHWPNREGAKTWFDQNKPEIFWLMVILVAGFILRTYALELLPYPWSGDESSVGIDARRLLRGEVTNLFSTGWSSQPNLSFLPTALSIALFGESITAIRMVSAFIGTLTILSTYLLAKEFFDQQVAWIAAIFLMAFPYHLQFSRIGVSNIFDDLNITLGLWSVYRAIRHNRVLDYVFTGVIAGLSFYTYVGSRLVPIILLGAFIYASMRERGYLRGDYPKIGVSIFSAFITIVPMAAYFIKHPDNFMTRIGQEGILLNGWLTRQAQITGSSPLMILLNQFSKSTLVFIASEAHGSFFNSPDPYLTLLGSVFFLLGMAYALIHFKETRFMLILAWFWTVVLFGGILTTNPPSNTRMVMCIPSIAIFLSLGIQQVVTALVNLRISSKVVKALTFGIVIILFLQNVIFYFGEYYSGFYFQDGNSELGMEVGLQLRQLSVDYTYYLSGRPRVFANFPTTEFLAPENPRYDISSDLLDTLVIPADEGALFVAIPDNMADLMRVEERFPGGSWEIVERKTKPEVLYYAYILEPANHARP